MHANARPVFVRVEDLRLAVSSVRVHVTKFGRDARFKDLDDAVTHYIHEAAKSYRFKVPVLRAWIHWENEKFALPKTEEVTTLHPSGISWQAAAIMHLAS